MNNIKNVILFHKMTYTVYTMYYGLQQGFPKRFARGFLLA
jgi:hypothetical protein